MVGYPPPQKVSVYKKWSCNNNVVIHEEKPPLQCTSLALLPLMMKGKTFVIKAHN